MRIIEPKVEFLPQGPGLAGIYKQIEIAGRTCYKSDAKITDDSYIKFYKMLSELGHNSMLEHGTVYLKFNENREGFDHRIVQKYIENKYSESVYYRHIWYVTTNMRVIVENGWEDDLNTYLCDEPSKRHKKRYSFRFTTQIVISREANRHKVNSPAEQSTRYCNFSSNKFENSVAINRPHFAPEEKIDEMRMHSDWKYTLFQDFLNGEDCKIMNPLLYWYYANEFCEYCYMMMIKCGTLPEDARTVLPLDTNTELVHTAFVDDWKHFVDLRYYGTTGKPHSDMKPLAEVIKNKLEEENLI